MNETHSLTADEANGLDMYWRAANYLGVAQIYLRDNCLLEKSLEADHIKPRLLGHWGTVPGINFTVLACRGFAEDEQIFGEIRRLGRLSLSMESLA